MKSLVFLFRLLALSALSVLGLQAQNLSPALAAKLEAQFKIVEGWAAEPSVVAAVKAQNAAIAPEYAALDQEKWRSLPVLDPLVRALTRNDTATFLKSIRGDLVSEAFVSDEKGRKVAFIAKTTNWSHLGKPKHDVPMQGKNWTGPIEVDESSGEKQIQIAVPVLDGGKPIGSLVVGLSISGLIK